MGDRPIGPGVLAFLGSLIVLGPILGLYERRQPSPGCVRGPQSRALVMAGGFVLDVAGFLELEGRVLDADRERRDDDDQLPCSARPRLPNRSEILAHSTQTSSGIIPAFINT